MTALASTGGVGLETTGGRGQTAALGGGVGVTGAPLGQPATLTPAGQLHWVPTRT